jgi:hypothetical protein
MTDWTLTSKSNEARKRAITNEFDRLIKELIARRVIRESMLGNGYYVIYTEDGPKDLNLKRLAPCVKIYPGNCLCYECDTNG